MKPEDKQRMLNRLLLGVPDGTVAHRELEKMLLSDLNSIEPIFDEIRRREVLRFAQHLFRNVLTPKQVIEVYQRLKAEGRLSKNTVDIQEAKL